MTLANMTAEETKANNTEHCKHIAHELEYYANGQMWRCDECGVIFNDYENGSEWDGEHCPHCGEECDAEQLSVYDWLEDALDITYTMNSAGQMMGASVLVAFGGPNIYVNTFTQRVELYWWGDRAEWGISSDACDELDDALVDHFEMAKAC